MRISPCRKERQAQKVVEAGAVVEVVVVEVLNRASEVELCWLPLVPVLNGLFAKELIFLEAVVLLALV